MKRHLYELFWLVETDVRAFLYREFKVYNSDSQAKEYGMKRELELNEEASIEVRAQDGYYFKYRGALEVTQIDGFTFNLT